MASQTKSPGSVLSVGWLDGFDAVQNNGVWLNPSNAAASDDAWASQVGSAVGCGYVLHAKSFGFTVPSDATVTGVVARIERHCNGTPWCYDHRLLLIPDGLAGDGDDQAVLTYWPTSDAEASYGGAADLWGCTLTPAIVNATAFGVGLQVWLSHTSPESAIAYVDLIRLTVHYSGGTPPSGPRSQGHIIA